MAINSAYADVEAEFGGVPGRRMGRPLLHEIRRVLWQAAADAAQMTRLASELAPLNDAPERSAQETLARELQGERDRYRGRLVAAHDEAIRLRHAIREAAAASRLALSRSGAAHGLPEPTASAGRSGGGISATADALEALAAAWSSLDEAQAHTSDTLDQPKSDRRSPP